MFWSFFKSCTKSDDIFEQTQDSRSTKTVKNWSVPSSKKSAWSKNKLKHCLISLQTSYNQKTHLGLWWNSSPFHLPIPLLPGPDGQIPKRGQHFVPPHRISKGYLFGAEMWRRNLEIKETQYTMKHQGNGCDRSWLQFIGIWRKYGRDLAFHFLFKNFKLVHPLSVTLPASQCHAAREVQRGPEPWVKKITCQSRAKSWEIYPPVNKHSNGKSPFSIGNTSSKGLFSIAMLVYQRVPLKAWLQCYKHIHHFVDSLLPTLGMMSQTSSPS